MLPILIIDSLDVSVVRPLKYYSALRILAMLLLHISGLPYSVILLDVVCFLAEWFPQHYHSDYVYPPILKGVTFQTLRDLRRSRTYLPYHAARTHLEGAMSGLVTPSPPYCRLDLSSSLADRFTFPVTSWYFSASPLDFTSRWTSYPSVMLTDPWGITPRSWMQTP